MVTLELSRGQLVAPGESVRGKLPFMISTQVISHLT